MKLEFDAAALRPLIEEVVTATVNRLEADRSKLDGKLAYSEPEAAALLGLNSWQLRDERLRGRIRCSQILGKRIRYTHQDLLDYLASRRLASGGPGATHS